MSSPMEEEEPTTTVKRNVFPCSPANYKNEPSMIEVKNDNTRENKEALHGSPIDQVPADTSTSGNSTKDWCFSPSANIRSVNQHRKLKRLRRIGENENYDSIKCLKERLSVPMGARNSHSTNWIQNNPKRGKLSYVSIIFNFKALIPVDATTFELFANEDSTKCHTC